MKTPTKLYRYRPLDDALLDCELGALRDSYLFAPPFAAMNDPMEAFYEAGTAPFRDYQPIAYCVRRGSAPAVIVPVFLFKSVPWLLPIE